MLHLPEKWRYSATNSYEKGESNKELFTHTNQTEEENVSKQLNTREEKEKMCKTRQGRNNGAQLLRREGAKDMWRMEEQCLKNLKMLRGNGMKQFQHKPLHVTSSYLSITASAFGLVGKDGNLVCTDLIKEIADVEEQNSTKHEEKCNQNSCTLVGSGVKVANKDTEQCLALDPLVESENFNLAKSRVETNIQSGRVATRNKKKVK